MSLKRKIISAIISTFAVVTFTTFVSAQDNSTQQQDSVNQQQREKRDRRSGFGKRNGFGRERRGGMMRGFERLNLTDTQKEQIRTIMEANRPNQAEFEQLRPLMEAKRNGTITAEQENQLKTFREQMKQRQELVKQQVLGVLTIEQRAEYDKMKAEKKQRREERQKMRQKRQNQNDDKDN